MHVPALLPSCPAMRRLGDVLLSQQDQAVGTDAVSESLKDALKHLVSSASPSVVLSTKPADVREIQVNCFAGRGCLATQRDHSLPPLDSLCFPRPPPTSLSQTA